MWYVDAVAGAPAEPPGWQSQVWRYSDATFIAAHVPSAALAAVLGSAGGETLTLGDYVLPFPVLSEHVSWQRKPSRARYESVVIPWPVSIYSLSGPDRSYTNQHAHRSTKPILQYANRLLPSSERALLAFQAEGPAPSVRRVPAKNRGRAVIDEADRLLDAYPAGTVAVIPAEPVTLWTDLRSAGWTTVAGHGSQVWERNGRSIMVLHPDDARGLEFDAVIVVEPTDFPQNFGRQGPLYTALTRPNRELAIVHTKPLPDALRRR